MDIQFAGDVLPMRDDRVRRDAQHIGNLFIAQAFYHLNQHIFLPFAQLFILDSLHIGLDFPLTILCALQSRPENLILNRTMVGEILLRVP